MDSGALAIDLIGLAIQITSRGPSMPHINIDSFSGVTLVQSMWICTLITAGREWTS